MNIGVDASRAFVDNPTGTENYSLQLLKALLRIDRKNTYTLYTNVKCSANGGSNVKKLELPQNFTVKLIPFSRLWTQLGLALECLIHPPDVLFIPAHTMPIVRWPWLKTVVTIHDLGSEFLPEYHKFPQKLYLNWSTLFAVKHAARIIAVSKNTKNDLIRKLNCQKSKIHVIYEAYKVRG